MLLTLASYVACFMIPLFVGVIALVPFRYHFYLSVFVNWLIFSLIVSYIVSASFNHYNVIISLLGGISGVFMGMIMVIPALFINFWGTLCLLASLNREKDALNCLILYPTFFAMGYSAFWFGMSVLMHFRLFGDVLTEKQWPLFIYLSLVMVSPAVVSILRRLFQNKVGAI